jgi:hypothetical protein
MEDLKIVYLKTIGIHHPFDRTPPVTAVTENVGNLLNLKRCSLYLQLWYENNTSEKDVQRCYNIFKLVAKKGTTSEHMCDTNNNNVDFYRESYLGKAGTFGDRKDYIKQLFMNINLRFLCFDVDKEKDKNKRREFTLLKLLTDEEAYNYFYDYWSKLEDYETVRNILLKVIPNKDVVDKIGAIY